MRHKATIESLRKQLSQSGADELGTMRSELSAIHTYVQF